MCKVPKYKLIHKKNFKLYKPLPIPFGPFESVSMDFTICFLEWERINAIFMVVDKFSKLAKFALTQINTTTTGTTKLIFDMWVRHNGMLEVIVID
jgi:hypothetical protein